jgi:CPA1 family monovalent cation:H+ antiporter
LLRRLDLRDDDPVGREESAAHARALAAALAAVAGDPSAAAQMVRQKFTALLTLEKVVNDERDPRGGRYTDIYLHALQAGRQAVLDMRELEEIGDDAFHRTEEKLDWLEMASGRAE